MIRNQTDYRKAMCKMIRKIQNSSSAEEINDLEMSIEDAEILNDCIENGFVNADSIKIDVCFSCYRANY